MREFKIAVVAGDGIGPEVTESAVTILQRVADKCEFSLKFTDYKAGGCSIDEFGVPLTQEAIDGCKASDAVLLGAVGGPKWDSVDSSLRPERALLGLRASLGLYSNLRPALMFPQLAGASPVKGLTEMDILIVRELTGGIYFGKHGRSVQEDLLSDGNRKGVTAFDTEEYSEGEIRRILEQGFRYAMGRRKKLTVVDKANVLETSRLWREIANEMAPSYPEVELDFLYVDNCSMQLINRPSSFDVIVTSNMFGDILSDEAGMITGSIGMLPSASLGKPGTPGMYEPVHGSAPDIAGTGKANPIAAILSASMLLRWSLGMQQASDMIENAVRSALSDGFRTADISGIDKNAAIREVSTSKMTAAIAERI